MPPLIHRRVFISSSIAALALYGCKKTSIIPVKSQPSAPDPVSSPPNGIDVSNTPDPVELSSAELGKFDITEFGDQVDPFNVYYRGQPYGYTDKISYLPGENVTLYLSSPKNAKQKITLNDCDGKSVFSFVTSTDVQEIASEKPWLEGYKFKETATVTLPSDLKSGFYLFPGSIPLVCKGNDPAAEIVVVYPSNTANAYCNFGGKSLYRPDDTSAHRATVVSFLRYIPALQNNYNTSFFIWLYHQNYKSVKYIADIDLDNYSEFQNAKVVIVTGHSEYWTRKARLNIDKFNAAGKNVLILSGNTMFFQVRYNLEKKLMICYKNNDADPLRNTPYSTIVWDDPILKYPVTSSIGADFDHAGYPNKVSNSLNGYKIAKENSPLLKGTGLKNGDVLTLPTIESDGAPLTEELLPGSNKIPVIDNKKLNFYKIELIGYMQTINTYGKHGVGTFIVFKKKKDYGTIVNVASMNWCSPTGISGVDKTKIELITKNMIDASINDTNLFTPDI